jgi:hypothetical protein
MDYLIIILAPPLLVLAPVLFLYLTKFIEKIRSKKIAGHFGA